MNETFEQLLQRLAQDQTFYQDREEATRQGAILPILSHLGWKTRNIREVTPEFRVGSGRVDYCLNIDQKKVMYIEVKRFNEDLERHEKQLLEYAFNDGVELAALTNGLLWWLYLPLAGGVWQQRRFFTIDIQELSPDIAKQHFLIFLSREAIFTGTALKAAKSMHQGKEKDRLFANSTPISDHKHGTEPSELPGLPLLVLGGRSRSDVSPTKGKKQSKESTAGCGSPKPAVSFPGLPRPG